MSPNRKITQLDQETLSRLKEKYGEEVLEQALKIQHSGEFRKQVVVMVFKKIKSQWRILFVKSANAPVDSWSLPQGGIEDNEADLQTAAMREFSEEIRLNSPVENEREFVDVEKSFIQAFDLSRICREIKFKGRRYKGKKYHHLLLVLPEDVEIVSIDQNEISEYAWLKKDEVMQRFSSEAKKLHQFPIIENAFSQLDK